MATKTTELSNSEYRAIKAYSKSDLDLANKSVALIDWSRNVKRDKSDVADIGNAVHAALLEADVFASDYVKMPEFDNRSNAGKLSRDGWLAGMAQSNKVTLSHDDYKMVIDMRDSALAHPVINKLLTSKGESEVSIFFEIDGVRCKCRTDRIVDPSVFDQHIIVDVKTTADVDKFLFSARDYRYDVQAYWYMKGYEELTGARSRFLFAVVGKNKVFGSHPARLFELDCDDIEKAGIRAMENLNYIKEVEEFGSAMLDVEKMKLPKRWD